MDSIDQLELTILLVSDSHEQYYMFDKLAALELPPLDVVIHSGDFTNAPMDTVNDNPEHWEAMIR